MEKPDLRDFCLTEHDLRWAKALEDQLVKWIFLISLFGWGWYSLSTAETREVIVITLYLLAGIGTGIVTAALLIIPLEPFLSLVSPRFRRVQRYQNADKRYRSWWVRTQRTFWQSLSGVEFERELAAVFRRTGLHAELTRSSGDEGVDIWLWSDSGKKVVQCKAHKNPVGPAVARELYGTLQHFDADGAILASTSGFTKGVHEYVRNKPIELLDLADIISIQEKQGI